MKNQILISDSLEKRQNFIDNSIEKNNKALIINFFTATWCPPCKMTKSFFGLDKINYEEGLLHKFLNEYVEELKKQNINMHIFFFVCDIDMETNNDLVLQYSIRSIPTFKIEKIDSQLKSLNLTFNAITNNLQLTNMFTAINECL
jgi:thiol-disulfide isomerase/thioredoxin